MSENSSSDTSMKFSLPVLILHLRTALLNVLIVLPPMVSKVVWLVQAFPLLTDTLLFLMSCKLEMRFLEKVKALPLFVYPPERKTTSRISVLLAVDFGFVLQEFKQRGSRIKLEKVSSLDMSHIPHETSFGTTLSVESQRCKIAVHCVFNKGFNDVPIESLCPNAQHLFCVVDGNYLTEIQCYIDAASELEFYIYPFSEK